MHQVFCISNVELEAAGEELFLNVTTIGSTLHIARGNISGWANCASGDVTCKISKRQGTMIVAERPNAFIRDPEPTKKEWDKV